MFTDETKVVVLVVDDDPVARLMVRDGLEAEPPTGLRLLRSFVFCART